MAEPVGLGTIFLRPTAEITSTPADYGLAYDDLMVPIDAQRSVSIWHVKAERSKGVVVVMPGSDRNKSRYTLALPVFVPNGYDVILMDYPGFGESPEAPLELGTLTESGMAVVQFAQSLHDTVIPFGISTGGPTAIHVARELDVAALLLEAPLTLHTEVEHWLRQNGVDDPGWWGLANLWVYPQIPPEYDIRETIKGVDEPKLFMHSLEDDIVPFTSAAEVYANAPPPKRLFEMRGQHGEMIELDSPAYITTVISWLNEVVHGKAETESIIAVEDVRVADIRAITADHADTAAVE